MALTHLFLVLVFCNLLTGLLSKILVTLITSMLDASRVSSPIDPNISLSINSGTPLPDPTEYRTFVGSLQYLSLPHIGIVLSLINSRNICTPTNIHWKALKRLLRYLRGTTDLGLQLYSNSPSILHACSDAG